MRGGHNVRIRSEIGARVPRPPRSLPKDVRALWAELARAVQVLGTFKAGDEVFFRLMVRTVALAEAADASMPPTARARILQSAGSMLNAFGLSPLSRERVKVPKDDRSPGDKLLAGLELGARR